MTEHMDRDYLAEQLDRLPMEMQPQHDLWPGIEARLESRRGEAPSRGQGAGFGRRSWGVREWGLQSLAALLFMAVGSLITWLSIGMSGGTPTVAPGESGPRVAAHGSAGIGGVAQPMAQTAGSVETVSFTGQAGHPLDVVEANYLRARDALWLQAVENREALPPGTLKVVEKNLEILERAISDLRKALALDPGNPNLERRLLDSHQRSIDLLRRVVREV